jgi:mono/diheme cytochrome c family protein
MRFKKNVLMAFIGSILFWFANPAFSSDCTQARKTPKAPSKIYGAKNPVKATPENISAGKALYLKEAKPLACAKCHGEKGDGKGKMAKGMKPSPRNFTCKSMMDKIPDGQLFWIIKNGSKGTGMMPFKKISDKQIWRIISYIRQFNTGE